MTRMQDLNRSVNPMTVKSALLVGLFAISAAGLAACGSDSKKTTHPDGSTTVTGPDGTTITTNPNNTTTTTDQNGLTTVNNPNGQTTVTATPAVNSDKTGNEPTLSPTSNSFEATLSGGTVVPLNFVQYKANTTPPSDANKTFEITGLDYDACIFGFNHGYSAFPTGKFNFAGIYLVNGTPGAALASGTYNVGGTTGMRVYAPAQGGSGTGYDLESCKAKGGYAYPMNGSVVLSAVASGSGAGTTGTMNITMSDGSTLTGAFSSGACGGGTGTQPVPPTPDTYACTSLN